MAHKLSLISSLCSHPNIIKMRGLAGEPLSSNFGIVLDRLYGTLEDKMDKWTEEKKGTKSGMCGCLFGSVDANARSMLMVQAITVAYDLSCALRYIHDQKWVLCSLCLFFLLPSCVWTVYMLTSFGWIQSCISWHQGTCAVMHLLFDSTANILTCISRI